MLPNYFLPEVDELPFSWMNRLALANGFKDTNDMLQSLGFIKGKAVKRQHDYLLKITKLMPKNDWTITLMKMYLAEDLQQERLIPELNEEEHLYLCPCCMQGRHKNAWCSSLPLSASVSRSFYMLETRSESASCRT